MRFLILLLFPILSFASDHDKFKSETSIEEKSPKYFWYLAPGANTFLLGLMENQVVMASGPFTSMPRHIYTREATLKDRLDYVFPELSLGVRTKFSNRHGFDGNIGASYGGIVSYTYVQGSYLFFPFKETNHLYVGAGVTLGISSIKDGYDFSGVYFPFANIPLSLGYQYSLNQSKQFFQVQATPFKTFGVTYGIGF